MSYGNKQRNKSKPSVKQIKELKKKQRKVEDETQIIATEESHEIIILNAEGNKKKNKDSKAVGKIEKAGRLYLIVSISAVAALEYSTNRTVKIYSQRQ